MSERSQTHDRKYLAWGLSIEVDLYFSLFPKALLTDYYLSKNNKQLSWYNIQLVKKVFHPQKLCFFFLRNTTLDLQGNRLQFVIRKL